MAVEIPAWQYAVSMLTYIGILLGCIELMRRNYKLAIWFWVAMLFTFPLWQLAGWFRWVKTLSVLLPIIFLGVARMANYERRSGGFWQALQKPWVRWFFYGIWFLNIAEASFKDVALGNHANALAGLLLCVTIPFADRYWSFSTDRTADILAYTTGFYNLMYTSWNMCFVYGESPVYFFSSVCILLAAELYPVLKRRPELYVISRAYTLAFHLLLRACLPALFPALMNSEPFVNDAVLHYWGLANGALCVVFVFWHMWQLHTGRAEQSFRRSKHARPAAA